MLRVQCLKKTLRTTREELRSAAIEPNDVKGKAAANYVTKRQHVNREARGTPQSYWSCGGSVVMDGDVWLSAVSESTRYK